MSARAVFLHQCGVLNKALVRNGKPFPPQILAEFEIIDGVEAGLNGLKKLGFLHWDVTNEMLQKWTGGSN